MKITEQYPKNNCVFGGHNGRKQSRFIQNKNENVKNIIDAANKLTGEQFNLNTAITELGAG